MGQKVKFWPRVALKKMNAGNGVECRGVLVFIFFLLCLVGNL